MAPSAASPYVMTASSIRSTVTHWATRTGRLTMCGIRVPGLDPGDPTRPYDPCWETKPNRLSLVTCRKCNGQSKSYRQ